AATTEAPPRLLSRRGRIPGCVYQPELVTLALCLRAKASPFWIMLLLVLARAIIRQSNIVMIFRTPPRLLTRPSLLCFAGQFGTFRLTASSSDRHLLKRLQQCH